MSVFVADDAASIGAALRRIEMLRDPAALIAAAEDIEKSLSQDSGVVVAAIRQVLEIIDPGRVRPGDASADLYRPIADFCGRDRDEVAREPWHATGRSLAEELRRRAGPPPQMSPADA